MFRNQRIKEALKSRGVSREAMGEELGVTHSAVTQRLNDTREIDSMDFINAAAKLTGYSVEYLLNGDDKYALEPKTGVVNESNESYLKGKDVRVVVATVDRSGRDMTSLVPVKAQAGYMRGYADFKYIEKLPAFSLPILKEGQYRMFEVDGESMYQMGGGGLHDGDIVIGQYLEDWFSIRDNRVYVIVSTEGVAVKRVINRLRDKENAVLVLKSDNKRKNAVNDYDFPDKLVRVNEILEVWELKAYISRQLSFGVDIWDTLNDLQYQIATLNEKMKRIES